VQVMRKVTLVTDLEQQHPQFGGMPTADKSHTRRSPTSEPPRRPFSDRTARASRQHAARRCNKPWIAGAPDMVLNHEPQRERPSDFCGCVE
jgi:hypothetical protein